MDSIKIDSGIKEVFINGDESRVITFNPSDVNFAEKYYRLQKHVEAKALEFKLKAKKFGFDEDKKENTLNEADAPEMIEVLKKSITDIREQIDLAFGAGTSQVAFGDALSIEAIQQFISGISPYITGVRAEKIATYTGKGRKRTL